MFSIAKITAMKRWVSLLSVVWIGVVLGGWQPLVWAETDCGVVTEIPQAQCEAALYDSDDSDRLIPPAQSRHFKHNGKKPRNHRKNLLASNFRANF